MSDVAVTPQPEQDVELGVPMDLPFTLGWGTGAEIINPNPIAPYEFRTMRRRDGQVAALYRIITLPIRSALDQFDVVAAERPPDEPYTGPDSDADTYGQEEADFVEQMFCLPPHQGGMSVPLSRWMAECLLAITEGFAVFEVVYHLVEDGPLKGKIIIRKMAKRPQDTVTFLADKHGGFMGIHQRAAFQGFAIDTKIYAPYAWYYAAQEEENPFYGQSYFGPAFSAYSQKLKMSFVANVAAQFRAVPARVGTMPPNPNRPDKENFRRGLTDLGIAGAMMVPSGYGVEEIGKNPANYDFVNHLNYFDAQMAKSILADFKDNPNRPALVDATTAPTEADMFVLQLETIMAEIETAINQHLLPNLIDWNFGTGLYPKFRFGKLSDKQKESIAQTFDKLSAATSVQVTPEFMHEIEKEMANSLGLNVDYDSVEARLAEENQAQREADLAQAAATTAVAKQTAADPAPKPSPPVAASRPRVLDLAELYDLVSSPDAD